MPGPVPKRSAERRRRNIPAAGPVETVEVDEPLEEVFEIPEADPDWHPMARQWYESLEASGQSKFYEASDWMTAYIIAESLSRDLFPQFVGMGHVYNRESGEMETKPMKMRIPIKGASLGAYLKGMSVLLVTEGDRRRMSMEINRPTGPEKLPAGVTAIGAYREGLA